MADLEQPETTRPATITPADYLIEAVNERIKLLHTIGAHLRTTGQHGYAANLGQIIRFIELLDKRARHETEMRRNLAQRYADWTPPPTKPITHTTIRETGERIKGDM